MDQKARDLLNTEQNTYPGIKWKEVTCKIDTDLITRVKKEAGYMGIPIKQYIANALQDYIDRENFTKFLSLDSPYSPPRNDYERKARSILQEVNRRDLTEEEIYQTVYEDRVFSRFSSLFLREFITDHGDMLEKATLKSLEAFEKSLREEEKA